MDKSSIILSAANTHRLHLNPGLPEDIRRSIETTLSKHSEVPPLHWIMSSGTTSSSASRFKLVGLSDQALQSSAQAANEHVQVTSKDRWLNVLPLFHVGGLGVLQRALVSNTECINLWSEVFKWNPHEFLQQCSIHQATLTSLVPTQVYDLVKANLVAPAPLRAIVVGGARLMPELYSSARTLGWPLLPSFGMTEVASQIATAPLESLCHSEEIPTLQLLPHVQARCDQNGILSIASPSLLHGYFSFSEDHPPQWLDPKTSDGWYKTQDRCRLQGQTLEVVSRIDEVLKVRGENVNLSHLRQRLEGLRIQLGVGADCALVGVPDARLGHKLTLVGESNREIFATLISQFNQEVMAFERIDAFIGPYALPRTPLGKILYQKLLEGLIS